MGNDFRRDLNRAFDDVSGSPSSNLSDRVRSAVTGAPRAREPYWLAAVAAVVIAVLIVGVLFLANPLKRTPSPVGGVNPTPSASATPSSSRRPTPATPPAVEQFVCTNQTFIAKAGSPTPPPAVYISGLRTGTHGAYDRLTIDLANGVPASVEIRVQTGTTYMLSPSGMQTTLKGKNGIMLVIHGADLHTDYSGPIDIVTGYSSLAEVKRIEDFEGTVQLGLGVNGAACYHAVYLTNPNRIVIDVQVS